MDQQRLRRQVRVQGIFCKRTQAFTAWDIQLQLWRAGCQDALTAHGLCADSTRLSDDAESLDGYSPKVILGDKKTTHIKCRSSDQCDNSYNVGSTNESCTMSTHGRHNVSYVFSYKNTRDITSTYRGTYIMQIPLKPVPTFKAYKTHISMRQIHC